MRGAELRFANGRLYVKFVYKGADEWRGASIVFYVKYSPTSRYKKVGEYDCGIGYYVQCHNILKEYLEKNKIKIEKIIKIREGREFDEYVLV